MESAISMQDIYKIYDFGNNEVFALSEVSLDIKKGEFVAIVGPSGSGKSTLMNIMGCLDTPTKGRYMLEGEDVSSLSEKQLDVVRKEKIGFIFQSFNLIPTLSAAENVELPLIYRKIGKRQRRAIALDALDKVKLLSRAHHLPSQMSGGQRQRVAIARAIALSPPIILADEPTGNLDSTSASIVIDLIINLQKCGATVVLITHNDEIARLADKVVRIKDGKIV
ncbi:MAG: ABC transporter ATP-binding protein [Oscillospiraceae bacterium]|nr:ABC transporter ATP-binding protein [Oscillospiraceae bacterium]